MIILISAVFPPEPVVSAYLGEDIATALSEKWSVIVLTPRPTRPMGFIFNKEIPKNEKFKHIILKSFTCPRSNIFGRMLESYSFGNNVVKFIERNRTGIQCIYIKAWPLIAQYLIVRIARKYSIPSVIHIQDIYPESLIDKFRVFKKFFNRLLLPIDKYSLQNSTEIITISPKMREYLIETRGLRNDKVKLIYNWQNEERFIKAEHVTVNDHHSIPAFTFMFLGSLSKTAGIDVIISAFAKSDINNSRLVIAGDGSEKSSLISLAERWGKSKIEFWDAPFKDVPAIQSCADVLIISLKKGASRFAFPSKIIAYMLSGKPILACVDEDSDTSNAIKMANCGWIVPPEEIDILSKIMINVSSSEPKLLREYGQKGLIFALDNYSKRVNLQNVLSIVGKTIKEGG